MVELSNSEIDRYSRQIRLSEIGLEGQGRLKAAKVLVVGAGGLGCPVLTYLAAAGVGTIGVIDADRVDESNLQRQVLYGVSGIGVLKLDQLRTRISDLNPKVSLHTYPFRLEVLNAEEIVKHYDIVVDGSDNFSTRYLLNDVCVVLEKPLVAASLFQFEGQLTVYNFKNSDGSRGPTLRCLFPDPPSSEAVPNCAEAGVLGVLPGIMGCLQANEVLKMILGIGNILSGKLLLYDALHLTFKLLSFIRNDEVVRKTRVQDSYDFFDKGSCMAKIVEITPLDLKMRIDKGEVLSLIDVREPSEREICHIGGNLIPMNSIRERVAEIPRDTPVVVYCRSGGRSGRVVELLQKEFGFTNLMNLAGGVLRWSDEVDSSVEKY